MEHTFNPSTPSRGRWIPEFKDSQGYSEKPYLGEYRVLEIKMKENDKTLACCDASTRKDFHGLGVSLPRDSVVHTSLSVSLAS